MGPGIPCRRRSVQTIQRIGKQNRGVTLYTEPAKGSLMAASNAPLRVLTADFTAPLRPWDGFGFNYVETAQTRDYRSAPQDYGGLSGVTEAVREQVYDWVFGEDGLRPGLLKLFLDPFHMTEPGPGYRANSDRIQPEFYEHSATTRQMHAFAREAVRRAAARGERVAAIVTLYGPPGWMTLQRCVRGRDLDPARRLDLVKYLVAYARYLTDELGLDVRAASLHNEGEDWMRWPEDGVTPEDSTHDYNLYWPPEQAVELLPMLRRVLDANGLPDVAAAPGETSNWARFHHWGYAEAIARDPRALAALGLITSHGFWSSYMGQWNADHRSVGIDRLRESRPELRAWTTSAGFGRDFGGLIWEAAQSIYAAKVNAIIPWAGIQCDAHWKGGDPNPKTAIRIGTDGTARREKEYFVYRHLTRAGRPGMAVAPAFVNDSEIIPIAFASNGTPHPDALIVANIGSEEKTMRVALPGYSPTVFSGWRTTPEEDHLAVPPISLPGILTLPAQSVTTLTASAQRSHRESGV